MNADLTLIMAKAKASLQAAELLAKDGFFDFAVSRAYYALFYVAEALLLTLGYSYSSHAAVIGAFGREFAKTGKLDAKFHRWLIQAQDYRAVGDYNFDRSIAPTQAQEVCAWARELIATGEAYITRAEATRHSTSTHDEGAR